MKIIGVIPARISSTRLPQKLLLPVNGKPLIQYTFEQAKRCKLLDEVVIAVDCDEMARSCQAFGAKTFLTNPQAASGTDRIAEAVFSYSDFSETEYIINIQGDEPTISPDTIEKVVLALKNSQDAPVATALFPLKDPQLLRSSSCVKCVRNLQGYALYFSRALIPSGKEEHFREEVSYFKHLGLYGYKKEFLSTYTKLSPTPLQVAEDLEQLKILENGYKIITVVADTDTIGIDTEEDFQRFKKMKELK
jgi:3-deoxy-manno-octulosonate cytidylyltransferase (CMP-KDO synthetase)